VADPGRVGDGVGACPLSDQQARPACERPWLAAERGHRMRLRREGAAPAAWLPSGAGWRPP
jgi:hypothetical protein